MQKDEWVAFATLSFKLRSFTMLNAYDTTFMFIRPFSLRHEEFTKRTATVIALKEKNNRNFEVYFTLIVRMDHEDLMYLELHNCFKSKKVIELWQDATEKNTLVRYYQGRIEQWREVKANVEMIELEIIIKTNGAGIDVENQYI